MDEVLDLDLQLPGYTLRKIAHVLSGCNAFTVIPLDETAAILNHNNGGKTSTISTLKLFLLPEVNFKDQETKFGFQSKGEYYTAVDSSNFYFPSENSFMICEVENPGGIHCQILYRGKNEFSYSRIFVRATFDELAPLFWNRESEMNEGMGEPTGITVAGLLEAIGDLEYLQVSDRKELRDILYTRYHPMKSNSCYSIIPMAVQSTEADVRTIRSLLHLAFDIAGSTDKSLPGAFANLIEKDLSNRSTQQNVDIQGLVEDYKALQVEQDSLNKLRRMYPEWLALDKAKKLYGEGKQEWRENYVICKSSLDETDSKFSEKSEEIANRRDQSVSLYKQVREQNSGLSKTLGEERATFKAKSGEQQKRLIELEEITTIRGSYQALGFDDLAIADAIMNDESDGIKAIKSRIESAKNIEASKIKLQSKINERNRAIQKKDRLEGMVFSRGNPFLGQIESHSADVLFSLNKSLAMADGELMSLPKEQIKTFASLFSGLEGELLFLGENVGIGTAKYNGEIAIADTKQLLATVVDQIRGLDKDIDFYKKTLTSSDGGASALLILEEDIQSAERELELIAAAAKIVSDAEKEEVVLAALEEHITILDSQFSESQSDYLFAKQELDRVQEEIDRLAFERSTVANLLKEIGYMYGKVEVIFDHNPIDSEKTDSLTIEQVEENVKNLGITTSSLAEVHQQVLNKLQGIAREGVAGISNVEAFEFKKDSASVLLMYEKIRAEFVNIDAKESEIKARIETHNSHTSTQISMIEQMAGAISTFEQELNIDLGEVKVSNLDSVKVCIISSNHFNLLRSELAKYKRNDDQSLMGPWFYERLDDFCSKYLVSKGGVQKLDIQKIIVGVQYRYEINGRIHTAAQSNGTSAMINAVLLSLLLRRLVPDDLSLKFPIIFDEVGSLQSSNLQTLRDTIECSGFTLFVANPENSGSICRVIDRWHNLSWYHLTDTAPVGMATQIYYLKPETLVTQNESLYLDSNALEKTLVDEVDDVCQ